MESHNRKLPFCQTKRDKMLSAFFSREDEKSKILVS